MRSVLYAFSLILLTSASAKFTGTIEVSVKGDVAQPGAYKLSGDEGLVDLVLKTANPKATDQAFIFSAQIYRAWGKNDAFCSYSVFSRDLLRSGHDIRLVNGDVVTLDIEHAGETQTQQQGVILTDLEKFIQRQPKDFYRLLDFPYLHGIRQPKDLNDFTHKGYLAPFDGKSDQALKSTRPPPTKGKTP